MALLDKYLSWPLWGRAALTLGLVLLCSLLICAPLLKILSLIPFLLKQMARAVYLLLEWLVAILHKLWGGVFYHVDNGLASLGERVDSRLDRWYSAWNKPKSRKPYLILIVGVFTICYLSVIVPPMLHIEEGRWQAKGWSAYLQAEDAFVRWLADHDWYISKPFDDPAVSASTEEDPKPSQEVIQIPLTVYRVSGVLAVRDIPSTVECTTLDTLNNGDVATWKGELAFGFADGRQEAWVKVTTDSGIEGWSRLNYLCSEDNIELTLVLRTISDPAASIPPAE